MRQVGKWVLRGGLALVLLVLLAFLLDPRDHLANPAVATPPALGADLDAYLANAEAAVPNIRDGAQKRIVWAGAKGQKTPFSIVYLHGFSASSAEIRPVPERLAAALGANLYFARLKGHGQDGPAMATASVQDWLNDAAEAMEIGRALGDRVIVIGTSTGATLVTIVAQDNAMRQGLAGLIFVSPNFGVAALAGKILDMPYARIWGPWVAGAQRSFAPHNAEHGLHWTTSYPTAALFPMAQLVRMAKRVDHSAIQTPVLTLYSPNDQVVSPDATRAIMASWGGPVQMVERVMTPSDDPYSHVIAGDILSPAQTDETVAIITAWARGL
jgi:alpha-beta hydrolase superfamily lysophospholipase